jgi:addiction module HigA family antidote
MSQAELSNRMGRPKKTINEIVKGKAAITAETALQLEKVLGVPASFWINRERLYREAIARRNDDSALSAHHEWARRFPVAKMVAYDWIPPCASVLDKVRELLRFFGIASPDQLQAAFAGVRFRKGESSHSEALLAWLRQGVIEGQAVACEPFSHEGFEALLNRAREWTEIPPDDLRKLLIAECAKVGVAVVFVPELPGAGAHGATRWLSQNKALLQLSLFRKTHDQLVFTFFHEAEHILRHGKTRAFVEKSGMDRDPEEIEANRIAGNRLIPPDELREFVRVSGRAFSATGVRAFATKIGIAPGIVVGRLQHDELLPFHHLNSLKVTLAWSKNESA